MKRLIVFDLDGTLAESKSPLDPAMSKLLHKLLGIVRVAVISGDLLHWDRLGLVRYAPFQYIDFARLNNKDASLFPIAIPNHVGKMQMAILHRPLSPGTLPEETVYKGKEHIVNLDHISIWILYCPMPHEGIEPQHIGLFNSHHRLATPVSPWERLKIGGGTPPILTKHGWLIIYHGVTNLAMENEN